MKIELRLHLKVEAVFLRFPGLTAEARVGEGLKQNIL
jgi:hypothetical protein